MQLTYSIRLHVSPLSLPLSQPCKGQKSLLRRYMTGQTHTKHTPFLPLPTTDFLRLSQRRGGVKRFFCQYFLMKIFRHSAKVEKNLQQTPVDPPPIFLTYLPISLCIHYSILVFMHFKVNSRHQYTSPKYLSMH